jgi:selenocysteine-specific elongation factor
MQEEIMYTNDVKKHFEDILSDIKEQGLWKNERVIVSPVLTEEQQKAKERILAQAKKEFLPVRPDELGLNANWVPELLSYLIRNGELVRAEEDLLVSAETFEKGIETLTQMLDAQGKITVAETRDALVTNRKVALSLLSAMDARKITRREGDERVRA